MKMCENCLQPSTEYIIEPSDITFCLLPTHYFIPQLLDPEDGSTKFIRNSKLLPDYDIAWQKRVVFTKSDVYANVNYTLHHEDVEGNGGTAPPFLTSALDGVVSSAALSPVYRSLVEPRNRYGRLE
jgi:hypothetical protein